MFSLESQLLQALTVKRDPGNPEGLAGESLLTDRMELFQSQAEYTVRGADSYLSCSRSSGSMEIKAASDVDLSSAVCLGLVEGVVGKFQFHTNLECFLILILQKGLVGTVPGRHKMYKITKVAVIPLTNTEPLDLKLEFCKTHPKFSSDSSETAFQRRSPAYPSAKRLLSGEEKLARRLLEELVNMFTNSDSFYYSLTYDITNSAQRQSVNVKGKEGSPSWTRIDDRFFWNKYMIRDLLKEKNAMAGQWIIPIIQGFVQMEEIHICFTKYLAEEAILSHSPLDKELLAWPDSKFLLILISRRSRYRGGMRYKRRGVDCDGNVANYVETEQLIYSGEDILSFVQIRGSVPVFWSQQGYRYKPRPMLHKSDHENKLAFKAHFEEQFRIYNKEVIINLVDQRGPEKLIGDAYLRQVEMLNDQRLIYVAFDFHHQCHHRKFENVEILTEGISSIINDLKWFRLTKDRVMGKQEGAPRVNCMDSLDRTNLVQTAIARNILEQQLKVLRILPQHICLPQCIQRTFQSIWANNGDIISRQYAGTAAMKSDFIRTGKSKFSGVVKDSYRSANRYYLHHFRHAYRQAVIDLMHGVQVTKDLRALIRKEKPAKALLKKEQRRRQKEEIETLIHACSSLMIPCSEKFLGGWLFIECGPRLMDAAIQDLDVMFLLSNHACYFAHIDKECEVSHYSRISLEEIEKIEIGRQPSTMKRCKPFYMRLHYTCTGKSEYYTLKTAFQGQQNSSRETLWSIAEAVRKAKIIAMGAELPVRVDNQCSSRITECLWALLVSCMHFLAAIVNSIIKACQQGVLKNRKVNMPYRDLVEASSNVRGMSEKIPSSLSPEQVKSTSGLIESTEGGAVCETDQETTRDQVFSIYLPKDGKHTLQDSDGSSTSNNEAISSGSSHASSSSSSSSQISDGDGPSPSSSSTSSSSSSLASDDDPTIVDRLKLTHIPPDGGELKHNRNLPQHPVMCARFAGRDGLPSVRGLGLYITGKYSNNLQDQSIAPWPAERKVPEKPARPPVARAPQAGKADQQAKRRRPCPGRPALARSPAQAVSEAALVHRSSPSGSGRVASSNAEAQGRMEHPHHRQEGSCLSEEAEELRESSGDREMD